MNYKKEMGLAIAEIKKEAWFIEGDDEFQKEIIDGVRELYTPPTEMQNTMLNGCMKQLGLIPKWTEHCRNLFPWADPILTRGEVGLEKRKFFTRNI